MNNKIIKNLGIFITSLLVISCGSGESTKSKLLTSETALKKYGSGVVLVCNSFYYSIEFSNGTTFYFSGIDSDGNISGFTADEDSIECSVGYGTGFYVSPNGVIATNAHVATPYVDPDKIHDPLVAIFNEWRSQFEQALNELNDEVHVYQTAIMAGADYEYELNNAISNRDKMQNIVSNLSNISSSNFRVVLHTVKLGVATNNTHVTKTTDFVDCEVLESDQEHDLALMQLHDKKTPDGSKIFLLDKQAEKEKSNSEKENSGESPLGKLFMIGFNLGPNLALTNEGIKAQINEGSVSQNTDNVKMMYSIPSLHGSSGAPVIRAKGGKVVAVNFAGLDNTQSFNYGIKVKHLVNLMEKAGIKNVTKRKKTNNGNED